MNKKSLNIAVGAALLAMAAGANAQIRPAYLYPDASSGRIPIFDSPLFFSP